MSSPASSLEPPGPDEGLDRAPALVVASNRLPIRWDDGEERWVRSAGGLVTALEPVLRQRDGVWVGWADGPQPPDDRGLRIEPVPLRGHEEDDYYAGFANATLWPAVHDAIEPIEYERRWWDAYRAVNRRFAATLARCAPARAIVWVHDYHLLLVPRFLRDERPDVRIGFFLHTPWPALSVANEVPHIDELVDGLEGADLVGFQRARDEARFRALRASRRRGPVPTLPTGVFPISVDVGQWQGWAADPVVQAMAGRIRASLGSRRRLVVGVDRMDYSKGILQRLVALERLFESGRLDPAEVRFRQIAVPSRQSVPAYRRLRDEVVGRARRLNDRYGQPRDPVVELDEESLPPRELAALYQAADVALVTSRRDGMNLVAKEFCVVQGPERPGVLVLGRGAGAADELSEAILVDGSDPASVAEGLERAVQMGPLARRAHAARLRALVEANDLQRWTDRFLARLQAVDRPRVGADAGPAGPGLATTTEGTPLP